MLNAKGQAATLFRQTLVALLMLLDYSEANAALPSLGGGQRKQTLRKFVHFLDLRVAWTASSNGLKVNQLVPQPVGKISAWQSTARTVMPSLTWLWVD